jgi:uncharacterized repeat protein (TIGR03803 family)
MDYKLPRGWFGTLAIWTLALVMLGNGAAAQREKVLHSFGGGTDGQQPTANVIFDEAGNLYGTTSLGGAFGVGTVFELTPTAHGWTEKVLYDFNDIGPDAYLLYSGLVLDSAGNLYGTTADGGIYGPGTAFELTKSGHGWALKILHNFGLGSDGECPCSNLIFDSAGNLYGTAVLGGERGDGIVFELTPNGTGEWKETILHQFSGLDGNQPNAPVVFDAVGNLFGTTELGGSCGASAGCGVVFELKPTTGGEWTETVIHDFDIFNQSGDGQNPTAGVVIDATGNVYGTTSSGGPLNACDGMGCGTIFELTPSGGGAWIESILHNFGDGDQGANITSGLIFDAAGNLLGSANGGPSRCGSIFELSPVAGGGWNEKTLFSFKTNACGPSSLMFDSAGNIYGTTSVGGPYNTCNGGGSCGTVFEVIP